MKKIIIWMKVILLSLAISLTITSCQKDMEEINSTLSKEQAQSQSQINIPDQIHFIQAGLYPEGIVFDKFNNRFLVSSDSKGTIGTVSFNGDYTPFIQDPELTSSARVHIDEARKRIITDVLDIFGDVAKVGTYDLQTGKRIWMTDLAPLHPGGTHLAVDIAIDPLGNLYITDAKSPVIYKVDVDGHASVFFEDASFAEPPGFPYYWVGFNGIVYDNNGFLIVGFLAGSFVGKPSLLRIPVDAPKNFSEVQLDVPLASPEGLLMSRNGKELIVCDNVFLTDAAQVVHLHSTDNWLTAKQVEAFPTGLTSPETATSNGKEIFVIYSYVHKLFYDPDPPQTEFMIQKMPFNINSF